MLTLGNAQRDFAYRKGTEDEVVITQSLKNRAYDISRFRRGAELLNHYESLANADHRPLIVDTAASIGAAAVFFAHKFPNADIVALEPDPAKFDLLKANTSGLRIECIQGRVAVRNDQAGPAPEITMNDICRGGSTSQFFFVKFAVEAGDLFAANAEWVERTAVLIAELADHLLPGTALTRTFVDRAAGWNRDFVYLNDTIFSISRGLRPSGLAA